MRAWRSMTAGQWLRAVCFLAGVGMFVWSYYAQPSPRDAGEVERAGPIIGIIVAVASAVWGAISKIGGFIGATIGQVVTWIINTAIPAIWAAVKTLSETVVSGFKTVWNGLKTLFETLLKGPFTRLFKFVYKLYKRVRAFLTPFINIVKMQVWAWKRFIDRYVMPIIRVIGRIRSVLAVLRLFHVQWAQRLDRFLLKIQNDIVHDLQLVTKKLNQVLNIMEMIVDPLMLIRQNVFTASFMRGLSDLMKLTTGKDLDWYTQDMLVPESTPKDLANLPQHLANWDQAVTVRQGWMADGGQYSMNFFDKLAG